MKIEIRTSRRKLAAGSGHEVDLLVTLKAPEPEAGRRRPPICLLPVVDVSGSMSGQKLAAVQAALRQLARHLVPGDLLGLVAFDSEARLVMPLREVTQARREEFLAQVEELRAGTNTNMAGGLLLALEHLERATRPRVILLTDGLANEGVAKSREQLTALVRERFRGVSLSAFGYGHDCDQVLLGELADAGGGSYAFIENADQVLSAFARELGGLAATYASDVHVELVPRAGETVRERLGDLLYGGELSWMATVAVAAHDLSEAIEIATVGVTALDEHGRQLVQLAPVRVDFVPPELAEKEDDPLVARARDERRLRLAQEEAEAHARRGDWKAARAAVAAAKLGDEGLRKFAEQVQALYGGPEEYSVSSGRRGSSLTALKRKRQLLPTREVEGTFGGTTTTAEAKMESSFRGKKKR